MTAYIIAGSAVLISGLLIRKYTRDLASMRASFLTLSQSFEELDEQARLIVKTDLELNKTQEELDKRLSGLDALQKLSRAINTTLDENEIFNRLSYELLGQIGFEKYMFLLCDSQQQLQSKRLFTFSEEQAKTLAALLTAHPLLQEKLDHGEFLSSFSITAEEKTALSEGLQTDVFVLAPILVQNHFLGVITAGYVSSAYPLTEGDTEMISLLADQLGQAIENARLFEEVYKSSHDLEIKVRERTRQLTEALERVQKINKTKSEFISAVSHELRTPLTSIKGYAAILLAGKIGQIPDSVKERLGKINKHSDSLVALINNLLDISRIESGKANLKFKTQPLLPMIEVIEDLLTPQLKEKRISLRKHIPADLPGLVMDASQIERVFTNLIGNAIKFTPVDGTITISAEAQKTMVCVSVADTGIGIKPEDIENLFDEFYRVENQINETVRGSGLGLSLVKKIIAAHHGTIHVQSTPGLGTEFSFCLPLTHEMTNPESDNSQQGLLS